MDAEVKNFSRVQDSFYFMYGHANVYAGYNLLTVEVAEETRRHCW